MNRGSDPRRCIESLRAGVPNRDAVSELGTNQTEIQSRFLSALAEVPAQAAAGRQVGGFLVEGGFGSGKSHLLEWLQHLAITQRFAVSRVVVSKEAPLNDPHKVFQAAIENLRLPDHAGVSNLHDVANQLDFKSTAFQNLVEKVSDRKKYDPIFAATLYLYRNLGADPEFIDRIVTFWAGWKLGINEIRSKLRELGKAREFDIRTVKQADLAVPRFRFITDLMAATGQYQGWVILLDELELIANFSIGARARSYGMIARLLGIAQDVSIPALFAVGCATDDFTGEVFFRRQDHDVIPQRLGVHPTVVQLAEAGMGFMWPVNASNWMKLRRLEQADVNYIYPKIRSLHRSAYGSEPPDGNVEWHSYDRSLRQYVREWITRWDLQRLYPDYRPDIETLDLKPDLQEDPDLEKTSEDMAAAEEQED